MPTYTMKVFWVAALLVLSACSGADKRDPEAVTKARAALEQGQVEVARMHAENAAKYTPDDPDTRSTLAAVHRALGARAQEKGDFGRAADAFRRAAEHEPRRALRASDYLAAFEAARDAGRPATQNTELLVAAVEAQPADLGLRLEAATVFDELGQARKAVEHYLFVWEADRSKLGIGMRLGLLYVTLGEERDAEAVFRRVLEQDAKNVQASLQLAELYERAGRSGRARAVYGDLVKAYPESATILFRYAEFLERIGADKEAERMLDDAHDALPGVERRKMRKLRSRKKRR